MNSIESENLLTREERSKNFYGSKKSTFTVIAITLYALFLFYTYSSTDDSPRREHAKYKKLFNEKFVSLPIVLFAYMHPIIKNVPIRSITFTTSDMPPMVFEDETSHHEYPLGDINNQSITSSMYIINNSIVLLQNEKVLTEIPMDSVTLHRLLLEWINGMPTKETAMCTMILSSKSLSLMYLQLIQSSLVFDILKHIPLPKSPNDLYNTVGAHLS